MTAARRFRDKPMSRRPVVFRDPNLRTPARAQRPWVVVWVTARGLPAFRRFRTHAEAMRRANGAVLAGELLRGDRQRDYGLVGP